MKTSAKIVYKFIGFLVIVAIVAMLLMVPPVQKAVAKATGAAEDKIRFVAGTIAGTAIGLILVNFGIVALASIPVVGIALILAGLALAAYALYPLFKKEASTVVMKPSSLTLSNSFTRSKKVSKF